MRKGIAPVLILAIAALVIVGVIAVNFSMRTEYIARAIREAEIIQAINTVEFTKKSLEQALAYSVAQGYYYTASRGGYADFKSVISSNCVPYWRIYDTTYFPSNYEKNALANVAEVFNTYGDKLKEKGLVVPSYTVSMKSTGSSQSIVATSSSPITFTSDFFELSESADFTTEDGVSLKKLFDVAKENFIDEDKVKNHMTSLTVLEDQLESSHQDIDFSFEIEKSTGSSVIALVSMEDKAKKYFVYDPIENSTEQRGMTLRFYILSGQRGLEPIAGPCVK